MLRQTSIAMDSPRLLDTREGADAAGNRVVTETFMFVRYWRPNAVAGGGFKELAWFGLDELLADRDGISAELHLTLCLADEAWGGVKA
jgi:hypothetical protein